MSPEPQAHERVAALPTGTVTFLFTDIEGSTQRWEGHRDAMKAAVARHEQIMSAAMTQHRGYVFKTVGDAFCVAFPTAPDALAAAADAQLSLVHEDFSAVEGLRVRMGLHTGYAEERNADYFGPTVNRVARLVSIGHGGQILLSQVTYDLARTELPRHGSLSDLGSHRLKDLGEPEHVWQLSIAELPSRFPPLKSLDELPNNLPVQPTSFRGRDRDVEDVKSLLAKHQLLTLTGAGGIGKTRLALQVGADSLDHYPDGVWLADLAPITDRELVSSVIAQVLGMTQVEGRRVDESIPQWLKRRRLLLILDNCEHMLEAVASIADAIVHHCPGVRLLATSRQALGIGGEEVLRLSSLSVPHKVANLTSAAVMGFGAVELFVDRAKSVDKSFVLSDDNAPIVGDICRRLDGIPLAIELAAARVKVLSVPNLAQHINERFKILTGGSRTALPRQKTLTALIAWSYDLLTPQEQLLFVRLSIFAGGFSLDAATIVCAEEGLDQIEILDLLSSLTDKSLLVADTTGKQERYRLLESTRAYALDKLDTGGQRDRLARRHAEYFRDQALESDKQYGLGSTFARLAGLELEIDNYRAALEWALTDGQDVVLGSVLAGALQEVWRRGGLSVEGRYWIERAQAGLDETAHPGVAARLWHALSALFSGKRMHDYAERAISLYESAGDDDGRAWVLTAVGHSLYQMGRRREAREAVEQALAMMRDHGDRAGVAHCLNIRAYCTEILDDVVEPQKWYRQALEAFKALGDEWGAGLVLGNLAELEFAEGHVNQALLYAGEALAIHSASKYESRLASVYDNLAVYRTAMEDFDGAREAAGKALRLARQTQARFDIAVAVQHFAMLAALLGKPQAAARLIGYSDAEYKALEQERESTEAWGYNKTMTALHDQLSDDEIAKLRAEGAAWSEDRAVEEALRV